MAQKYDQRTLNKVYLTLRNRIKSLEITKWGFKQEAKRYYRLRDNDNFVRASRLVEHASFSIEEFRSIIEQIKTDTSTKKQKK